MVKPTKRYPKEFRENAVHLVQAGRSVKDVASQLGVARQTLYQWVARAAPPAPGSVPVESEREELQRLRKRVARLEMEREILKKAAAFFAKENADDE